MATRKKLDQNYNPGPSSSNEDQEIVVLANFDEQANFVNFIGPGGKKFFLGSAGVNQLVAGAGIAISPNTGVGTVTISSSYAPGISSVFLNMPSAFVVDPPLITTNSGFNVTYGTGQIPPTNVGIGAGSATNFLDGTGNFSPVVGTALPYLSFVSSNTPGPNQPFTDPSLSYYNYDATRITVLVNGVALQPVVSYTLTLTAAGPTLTIVDYLETGSTVEVISKALIGTGGVGGTLDEVLANGNVSTRTMSVGKVTQAQAPTADNDLVRLVDLQTGQILKFRDPVVVAAVGQSVGTEYIDNGGIGFDQVTGPSLLTIDGVTPTANQRVLLTSQAAITGAAVNVSNGIYQVTTNTASGFILIRTNDIPSYGNYYFVQSGNVQDSTSWINNTTGTIVVGTTPITYVQFFASPNAAINAPQPLQTAPIVGASVRYAREDHAHQLTLTTAAAASGGGALSYTPATATLTFTPANVQPLPTGLQNANYKQPYSLPRGTATSVGAYSQLDYTDLSGTQVMPTSAIVGVSDSQTLTNKTLNGATVSKLVETYQTITPSTGAMTVDVSTGSIFFVSGFIGSTALTINGLATQLTNNTSSLTFAVISGQATGSTGFINSIVLTGATTSNIRWLGGVAPTAGNASGTFDLYQISVVRLNVNSYNVLASRAAY